MTKKLPLLAPLILTLTISTLATIVPTPTFAAEPTETRWSLAEIAALKAQVDTEDELACGDDPECREDRLMERLNSGDNMYWAVEELSMSNFIVSSINPSAETISLYFQEEDYMLKRMGIDEPRHLSELYMFWLEDGMIGPAKDTIDIYNYSEDVKNDISVSGMHPLISKNEAKDGENWLPPRTEAQYSVAGSNLVDNREGILYFTVNASGLIIGLKDYSECINSPDYIDGMECRIMFNESGYYSYVPMLPAVAEVSTEDPTPASTDAPSTGPTTVPEPTSEPIAPDPSPILPEEPGKGATEEDPTAAPSIESSDIADNAVDIIAPKSPDTGAEVYPGATYGREIELPWWIVALITTGIVLLVWWFVPNHSKLHKNNKNLKKS